MNVEIPGFYYDPEKKKYFKIQANHVAPQGAQYSKETVKRKRNEQQEQLKRARIDQRLNRETVRKPSFLHHPLMAVDRELGSRSLSSAMMQERQARVYVSQLKRRKLHAFEPWPGPFNIRHVLRNPRSGALITSIWSSWKPIFCLNLLSRSRWRQVDVSSDHGTDPLEGKLQGKPILDEPQWLSPETEYIQTDIFNLPQPYRATMDSGPEGDSFLAPRLLPNPDEGGDYRWPSEFLHPLKIHTTQTLWCSAACPVGEKALFAIGTSHGLHTLEGLTSMWTVSQKSFSRERSSDARGFRRHGNASHDSVQAVEWLSSDVIASGLRNSNLYLYDIRNGGSALRLQHSQSVTKIRRVDPWRIVVGGYNTVEMYDLRFVAKGLQPKPKPMSGSHVPSRPYLSFQDFTPEEIPDMDVSAELGLLACASHDRKVHLFSLQTGESVKSSLSNFQYKRPITSMCFETTEEPMNPHGPQTPSLLVCSQGSVDQWIW
ncbi:hypothetical protein PDE_04577 [Penicillium oxalicum 114-2]|uniref:Uncharacterized protein n=1 Tax=Penicillium oxalicum (strain 114-2 / CGMCC 5302) TaxID=933388 RepID=S8B4X4_PENO1|nr:hypothetical protein PDE_04577 [Penicillium oxalicum 114-2]